MFITSSGTFHADAKDIYRNGSASVFIVNPTMIRRKRSQQHDRDQNWHGLIQLPRSSFTWYFLKKGIIGHWRTMLSVL
jgi:hypothetical protein